MVLLRLRQYIDVHCVSDSQEDVGSGFKGTAGDGICHVAFDSVFVSNGCGGIDPPRKMMYTCIMR